MKRVILWVDRHPDVIMGVISALVIVTFIFSTCWAISQEGLGHPLEFGNWAKWMTICWVLTGMFFATINALVSAWHRTVRWAERPQNVQTKPVPPSIGAAANDPFLEAARREVEEIAPEEQAP